MKTSKRTADFIGLLLLYLGVLFFLGSTAAHAQSPVSGDSIKIAIAPEYNEVRSSHLKWFGENYRDLWATPVKMRIFRLDQERGGMRILKQGGGQQTKSLRLEDPEGNQWVLRTVDKDPELALPEDLRATVAQTIVQDQISASHPFGALVVPPLAERLGIPHANPEIVYLPDDPALGEYRELFANKVYLYEEREPHYAEDTDNTMKVLEKLEKNNKHRYDQPLLLRARLLDIVLGDWDRHQDQWRWIETEDEIGDFYLPVPRDRDQVFFTNEGIIPKIGSRKWIMPKFQGFDAEIRDIKGFNFNARHFDRRFLNGLEEKDWLREISYVQHVLTDELIEQAVRQMPANIFALSGQEIIQTMIARRNALEADAMEYYRFISEAVDIPVSDKRELIAINYGTDESIEVTIHDRKKDGREGRLLYQRRFDPEVTKEIRVYGRGARDSFAIAGAGKSAIKVRLIGGGGADTFSVPEDFTNRNRLFIYDRSDKENHLPEASLARLRTSTDSMVNHYDPTSFKYDLISPRITGGYNLDDGVYLGAGFVYTKHGFRKEPFAARHKLVFGHALATDASFFSYSGDFTDVLGKNDLRFRLDGNAPNNTSNFFGIGNETEFVEERGIQYHRSRYDLISARLELDRDISESFSANIGLRGRYYNNKAADNRGRFITEYHEQHPDQNTFSTKYFAGISAGFELDTRDDDLLPRQGVHWTAEFMGMDQMDNGNGNYAQAVSDFSFYFSPKRNNDFVVANRIGGGTTVGDPDFFQLLYLGGNENLRGFRNFRFAGESILYHNLELRLKLFDFTSYLLPGSVGLIGFNDVGRVWTAGERSKVWQHGFGGGFYLIPAKTIVLQGVVGFSEEEILPHVSIGFQF